MTRLAERHLHLAHSEPEPAPEREAGARADELRLLEALLFASTEPLDEATLASRLPDDVDVGAALHRLQAEYAAHGVNLVRVAGKWTFRTAEDLAWLLAPNALEPKKLSRAALETLAIIAYHQPVDARRDRGHSRGLDLEGDHRRALGNRLD